MTNIYKHSSGITFEVSTDFDLTSATKVSLLVKKPSNKTAIWNAEVLGDPTGGMLTYITEPDDLNEDGWFYMQSYAEFPTGKVYYGSAVKFKVLDAYEVP